MITKKIKMHEPYFGSWYVKNKIYDCPTGGVYTIEREDMGMKMISALKVFTIPKDQNEIRKMREEGLTEAEIEAVLEDRKEKTLEGLRILSHLKGNTHILNYEDHQVVKMQGGDVGWVILIKCEYLTPLTEYLVNRNDDWLEEEKIIKLGIDLCRALELCEKVDVIHRDIKPDNIFISKFGEVKLGDFGCAIAASKGLLRFERKGSLEYMAPEIYWGDEYDHSSDLYSLGLVLYMLLNYNRLPFQPAYPNYVTFVDKEIAVQKRMANETIEPPARGSESLKEVVLKACAFEVEDGYQSANEMRKDLERALACVNGAHDSKAGSDEKRQKLVRRTLAACILVMLLAWGLVPKHVMEISGIEDEVSLYVGDSINYDYQIKPFYLDRAPMHFTCSDDGIEVDKDGTITAKHVGTSVMKMSAYGYDKNVVVNVVPKVKKIEGISSMQLQVGCSEKLNPRLAPQKFSNEEVTYTSSDNDVVSIDENGEVKAKREGFAEVTVSAGGCSKSVNISVWEAAMPPEPRATGTPGMTQAKQSRMASGKSD